MEAVLTRVKLTTSVLKDLVEKAAKGSTMNDVIPLSCLMQVKVSNNELSVKTTDNINFVTLKAKVTDTPDFEMVVQTKTFTAIVSKLNAEFTTLTLDSGKLTIECDGTYNMPLSVDADGSNIRFPEPTFEAVGGSKHLTIAEIKSILNYNKACKAESKENPALYNYYFDSSKVITSDGFKACSNPVSVVEQPTCLPPALVELIPVIDGQGTTNEYGVDVQTNEDSVLFTSERGFVYGKKCLPADLEAYPAEGLTDAININATQKMEVTKESLLKMLERISLFVDPLSHNMVTLTFTNEGITSFDPKTKSTETIGYAKPYTGEAFSIPISVDANALLKQVTACSPAIISIGLNSEQGIGIEVAGTENTTVKMVLSVVGE